mmetsp:Transcript_28142/g.71367  ORF Transcript_28142/g.71367 Transcript_28142/m.71367 type:complete len:1007 (-) Transcript_28142:415-3435(-)|eukprot:CAMPEP_0178996952 /NCGR_PEP_ID=MMETSP0795-20121207/8660_1 /TAXON_ID=88552 /ORGANISM="Amoebophrya sp., Strain Ameob2" /LENGTH=1006 /DNA_ID=CAMNT_0020689411 /DNA_START=386 /DNA_END=3406 /DNA_ORIENTATION=+
MNSSDEEDYSSDGGSYQYESGSDVDDVPAPPTTNSGKHGIKSGAAAPSSQHSAADANQPPSSAATSSGLFLEDSVGEGAGKKTNAAASSCQTITVTAGPQHDGAASAAAAPAPGSQEQKKESLLLGGSSKPKLMLGSQESSGSYQYDPTPKSEPERVVSDVEMTKSDAEDDTDDEPSSFHVSKVRRKVASDFRSIAFPQRVEKELYQMVEQVCELTGLEPADARLVLREYKYDVHTLTEAWFNGAERVCKRVGLFTATNGDPHGNAASSSSSSSSAGGASSSSSGGEKLCTVCYESFPANQKVWRLDDLQEMISKQQITPRPNCDENDAMMVDSEDGAATANSFKPPERTRESASSAAVTSRGRAGTTELQKFGASAPRSQDDEPLPELFQLPCGHTFCTCCWKQHLTCAVDDGVTCLTIKCMEPKCSERVRWSMWAALAPECERKVIEYEHKSFIELNPCCKWCPTADCQHCILVNESCRTVESVNPANLWIRTASKRAADVALHGGQQAKEDPKHPLVTMQRGTQRGGRASAPGAVGQPAVTLKRGRADNGGGEASLEEDRRAAQLVYDGYIRDRMERRAAGGGRGPSAMATILENVAAKLPAGMRERLPRIVEQLGLQAKEASDEPLRALATMGDGGSPDEDEDLFCSSVNDAQCVPLQCKEVECGACEFKWCFTCNHESHPGIYCHVVRKWMEKNQDEAENVTWIIANTKACPKCKNPIEKNQGCMHIVCRCGHQFCWLCLADDYNYSHTRDGRPCNKFINPDEEKEMSRKNLARYAHFYERYRDHSQSQLIAQKKTLAEVRGKMEDLQRLFGNWEDVLFLEEAIKQVIDCRRMLKWTYAFAYFLGSTVEFFAFQQGLLEQKVDQLQGLFENSNFIKRDLTQLDAAAVTCAGNSSSSSSSSTHQSRLGPGGRSNPVLDSQRHSPRPLSSNPGGIQPTGARNPYPAGSAAALQHAKIHAPISREEFMAWKTELTNVTKVVSSFFKNIMDYFDTIRPEQLELLK